MGGRNNALQLLIEFVFDIQNVAMVCSLNFTSPFSLSCEKLIFGVQPVLEVANGRTEV